MSDKNKGAYWLVHRDYDIDLSLSKNPLGCSKLVQDTVNLKSLPVEKYPETKELVEAISFHFNIPKENISIDAGIDGFINFLPQVFLKKGDNALMIKTTFPRFVIAVEAFGGNVVYVPMKDMKIDFNAFKELIIKNNPKIIFIANPNNPTGLVEDKNKLIDLIKSTKAIVVMDEAGIDFVQGGSSLIKEATELDNLIVLRGFSKGHGMSGLRVAFCVTSSEIISKFQNIQTTFPVSSISMKAAVVSLSDKNHLKQTQKLFKREGKYYEKELTEIGFKVLPPESNLIFAKVPDCIGSGAKLIKRLHKRNMHCVDGDHFGFPDFIRINPATHEINQRFIEAIKQIIENKK